jgi:hypothetical protein
MGNKISVRWLFTVSKWSLVELIKLQLRDNLAAVEISNKATTKRQVEFGVKDEC